MRTALLAGVLNFVFSRFANPSSYDLCIATWTRIFGDRFHILNNSFACTVNVGIGDGLALGTGHRDHIPILHGMSVFRRLDRFHCLHHALAAFDYVRCINRGERTEQCECDCHSESGNTFN